MMSVMEKLLHWHIFHHIEHKYIAMCSSVAFEIGRYGRYGCFVSVCPVCRDRDDDAQQR